MARLLPRREPFDITECRYTVVCEPAAEGYGVTVPALRGLVSDGDTLGEARKMAVDAIPGYRASLQKHGEKVPVGKGDPIIERAQGAVSRP
jgi:predicted RNase H-like HicB family nuclease